MINRSNRLLQLVLALFLVLLTVLTTQRAQAQDETPSSTITKDPTDVSDEEAIEKSAQILKDKIATKVAKLTQQNDKVVTGAIASIDETAIKLQGDEHKDLTIETDEILTQYKSINLSSIEKITREDLSKGDYIVASGTSIDKELSANFILK
ncbi:MAG: hypothetical protein ACE5DQ_01620, partial [Candidatus Paceibacterota bacterium]